MFWTGLIVLGVITLGHSQRIHDDMTDDEIKTIFRTTRDAVPKYEAVRVLTGEQLFSKDLEIEYTAFGKKMYDYLQPADEDLFRNDTPVYLAIGNSNQTITYQKMKDGIVGIAAESFKSPLRHSALLVRRVKGSASPKYDGQSHQFTIRSLSPRLQEIVRRKRGMEPSVLNQTSADDNFHVIIKSDLLKNEKEAVKLMNEKISEVSESSNKTNIQRTKRAVAEVLYPTMIVVTDYERVAKTTNEEAYIDEIVYQMAFWNAVDLRYRVFDDPKVRLRVAALIIGHNPAAIPWMRTPSEDHTLDADKALRDVMNHWSAEIQRGEFENVHYDFLVTLTQQEMVGKTNNGGWVRLGGIAQPAMCDKARYGFFATAVLVQDDRGFGGVLTAVHEIGHMLGFLHDPQDKGECGTGHGYIMQTSVGEPTENNLHWSPCHLKKLSELRGKRRFFCSKKPTQFKSTGEQINKILPGFLLDDHRQCQARGYSYACEQTPGMCKVLRCHFTGLLAIKYGGWTCYNKAPPAEGTVCDPKKRCIDGECQCTDHKCLVKDHLWSELNGYTAVNMNLSHHA